MKNQIFISFIALFTLNSCPNTINMHNVHRQPNFTGIITEMFGNSILVRANDGEEIKNSADLVYVSIDTILQGRSSYLMSSDEVTVFYDGVILETYPAQINKVYAILLISPSKRDRWQDTVGIDLSHIAGSRTEEWSFYRKQQIDDLYDWFVALSLTKAEFTDVESPSDSGFTEVYNFALHISYHYSWDEVNEFTVFDEIEYFTFSYGNSRNIWYLYFYEEWYIVNNPSIPFTNR